MGVKTQTTANSTTASATATILAVVLPVMPGPERSNRCATHYPWLSVVGQCDSGKGELPLILALRNRIYG